jgi:hypothetical protein
MRIRKTLQGLSRPLPGARRCWNEPEKSGLRGHLLRHPSHDHDGENAHFMEGTKTFEETDPGFLPGSKYPTNEHPIQGFTWSDFTARPGRRYTYRIQALTGTPSALTPFREVALDVTTESEAGGNHDVFFAGAAASQEFARRRQREAG